jgi:hypothetical protein
MAAPRDVLAGALLGASVTAGVAAPTIVATVDSKTIAYGRSPVIELWTSAIALGVAGLITLLLPQLQRHLPFIGAGISVELVPAETYELVPLREAPGASGFFTHLHVGARRLTLRACECWIVGVETRDGSRLSPVLDFRVATRLHWAHETVTPFTKDIARGTRQRVDLLNGVPWAPGGAFFFCEDKPGSRTGFTSGSDRAQVRVTADNARAVTLNVDFAIRDWNDIEIADLA